MPQKYEPTLMMAVLVEPTEDQIAVGLRAIDLPDDAEHRRLVYDAYKAMTSVKT